LIKIAIIPNGILKLIDSSLLSL
jgi:hypothetical protein